MLSLRIEELPDDIIENIYSKVIFEQPKNLLDEIIKYGKNREYLYYLNKADDNIILECLYDVCVVYILIKSNKTPYSCDKDQLSDTNLIELEKLINETYDYYGIFNSKYAYDIIYYIIMNIDDYYTEKIVEPLISTIKLDELDNLGYLTYNGV